MKNKKLLFISLGCDKNLVDSEFMIGMLTAGLIVFAEREWRRTIKSMSMLLFSAACFGGVLGCISEAVGMSGASGMMLAGLLVWNAFRWKKEQSFETGICEVRLEWEERSCIVRALIDSGNMLHEPLTGEAVSILQKKQAEQLLGEDWELRRGFYLIPYHSLGTEKDWMQAVRIDRMQIRYKEKEKMAEAPVIALYQGQIGKRYQMILHQEHVGCEAPEKTPELLSSI